VLTPGTIDENCALIELYIVDIDVEFNFKRFENELTVLMLIEFIIITCDVFVLKKLERNSTDLYEVVDICELLESIEEM